MCNENKRLNCQDKMLCIICNINYFWYNRLVKTYLIFNL